MIRSFNIRGLGSRFKHNKVREFIVSKSLEFIMIQETKIGEFYDYFIHALWGNSFCGWSFSPSLRNGGGILSIWCSSKGTSIFSFVGSSYLGVCLEWGMAKMICSVVNIYYKCSLRENMPIWRDLFLRWANLGGDVWCVLEDFNSFCLLVERIRGGLSALIVCSSEIFEFHNLISEIYFLNLPFLGRCFNWYRLYHEAGSRLDIILISDSWWELWETTSQWDLPRDVSDHCPIIFIYSNQMWGHNIFRFNNNWLSIP